MPGHHRIVHGVEHGVLQRTEAGLEIFRIRDVRSPGAHLVDSGGVGRASERETVLTFIYMYERDIHQGGAAVLPHDRMQGCTDILALA